MFRSIKPKIYPRKEANEKNEPVFVTLEEAKRDSDLVGEIYNQLNSAKLTLGSSNNYVAGIKFKSHQYYILGAQEEWELFFGTRPA